MEHSKQKGNLGFSSTVKELHKFGVNVFSEIGDYSRVDLIAETQGKLIKIQIKYATSNDGFVDLYVKKSGPNGYKYTYTKDDVDLFSLYIPELDKVLFIPATIALQNKTKFKIRLENAPEKRYKGAHYLDDFEDLKNIFNMAT